jgi:hypothetical protein
MLKNICLRFKRKRSIRVYPEFNNKIINGHRRGRTVREGSVLLLMRVKQTELL